MDAAVSVCSWNTNGLVLGHRCSGHRMHLEHERNYALGMDAAVSVCSWNTNGIMLWAWMIWSSHARGTRTEVCFGRGCSGHGMHLEHERNHALGMDAAVSVCNCNANGIMLWAWMVWSSHALGTRTELCPTELTITPPPSPPNPGRDE